MIERKMGIEWFMYTHYIIWYIKSKKKEKMTKKNANIVSKEVESNRYNNGRKWG